MVCDKPEAASLKVHPKQFVMNLESAQEDDFFISSEEQKLCGSGWRSFLCDRQLICQLILKNYGRIQMKNTMLLVTSRIQFGVSFGAERLLRLFVS